MASNDGDPHGTWPDQDQRSRWHQALIDVTERLREERGIADAWRLTVGWAALWAEYGDLRIRVAGEGAELHVPEDLFEVVDSWVAFDRMAGPGRVLDRDRQSKSEWRQRLPAIRQFWENVARRVFRDVEATTDLRPAWKVVVHEDEPAWPGMPDGLVGGMVGMDMTQPARRPLPFPQVWLETAHTGRGLPEMTDEAEAIGLLADLVQDDVIEQVHGAWPPCPRHSHPLEVHYRGASRPLWKCPEAPDITVAIGELGESSARSN